MTGSYITEIRRRLGLTQVQLAQVLGVHAITVSRWENNKISPSPWCEGLLAIFASNDSAKEAGERAKVALVTGGTPRAIYELLRHTKVAAQVEALEHPRIETE